MIHKNAPLTSGDPSDDWSGAVYWYLPSGFPGGAFILDGLRGGSGLKSGGGVWGFIKALFTGTLKILTFHAGTVTGVVFQAFGFDNPISAEPVDLATGAYLWEGTDLTIGNEAAPKGLSFSRSYNSLLNREDYELGNGWTHNWDITLQEVTHFPIQFGGRLPVDTAAQIVASFVATDLSSAGLDDAREIMGLMLTAQWGTDAQNDNAVMVKSAHAPSIYSRQPDGTYTPPRKGTSELTN